MKVYLVREEVEGDDGIREFSILGTYFDRNDALTQMQKVIKDDSYGLIARNGIYEEREGFFQTNYDNGFVEWSVTEQLVTGIIPFADKRAIYDEVKLEYRTQDVYSHVSDMDLEITDADAVKVAEIFINKYNCDIPENDSFECIIRDYISEKTETLEELFQDAVENDADEYDFYKGLLDSGYTLEDIKVYLPKNFESTKAFLENHGLLED